jgi:transposase
MPDPLRLELTPEQRAELEQVRDRHPKPYLRERAAALLKIAEGQTAGQVAHQGLLKERYQRTVRKWLKRYRSDGLVGLMIKAGRGRKPAFSPTASER